MLKQRECILLIIIDAANYIFTNVKLLNQPEIQKLLRNVKL
jgi:hypothetical protein